MAYNFYKTPTQQELEALQLIKDKQNIQAQQNKSNFFDSVGAPNPTAPQGPPGQMQPFSPNQLQQLVANNLMSPNQMQGSANNAGLAIGSMLSKMFGPKNQPTVDPAQAEDGVRAKAALQVAQRIKQGLDPVEASRQVSVELIKAGADKGDSTLTGLGMKLFDQYQDMAKKKQDIDKFTPVNMMGPDGKVVAVTTPEQQKGLADAKFTLTSATPANPDVINFKEGTDIVAKVFDRSAGLSPTNPRAWVPLSRGQNSQLTGEIPKASLAKREEEYSKAFTTANGVVDLVDSIKSNIDTSKISGSSYGRAVVNATGGILGTIKALAPEISNSTMDPANYKEILSEHRGAITASGMNDATFIRLATMLAAQEKFTDGEANKTSVADVKLKLESIGGHLGDPDTVKAILDDVKQGVVKDLSNKMQGDLSFDSYPWSPGVKSRYKQLQDRVNPPKASSQSVDDFLQSLK